MATTQQPRPSSDDAALKLMKEHGIISKDMTWEKIEQISKKIGGTTGGGPGERWSFWVKGKYINRDDDAK